MITPSGESEYTLPEKSLDILSEQAAFLQDVATLISELPSSQQAQSENYSFTFPVLPLSTPYELPTAFDSIISEIDDLTITIGDAHNPEYTGDENRPAYLSIDVSAGSDTFTLSRSGLPENDNEVVEIHKIEMGSEGDLYVKSAGSTTRAELNALLMSIALPNSIADYSAYSDKELQSSHAFESLKELLAQKAYSCNESLAFLLKSGEADIHFFKEAGQLTSFTLNYYDEKLRLPVSVEYDNDTDFRLCFFGIDDGEKHTIIPTADEISRVRAFLKQEIAALSARRLGYYDSELIDDHTDSYRRVATNELAGQTEEILNELGLNPPNPGA